MRISGIHRLKYIFFITVLSVSFLFISSTMAEPAEPGTDENPLVSKDYVDARINEVVAKIDQLNIDARFKGLETKIDGLNTDSKIIALTTQMNDLIAKNKELSQTITVITNDNRELKKKNDELTAKYNTLSLQAGKLEKASKFEVVEVSAGKQILAGAGTEIILRYGEAKGVAGKEGGLLDTATGKDLGSGVSIPVNHLLISSRDDGRGIKVAAKAWLLIRGTYTVK